MLARTPEIRPRRAARWRPPHGRPVLRRSWPRRAPSRWPAGQGLPRSGRPQVRQGLGGPGALRRPRPCARRRSRQVARCAPQG
eukprot:4008936-Lingulodinium_polyedra.AAC.1